MSVNTSKKTEILILGSDISALFLALQFIRYGHYPKIIDQNTSQEFPFKNNLPIVLNIHTLEMLEQLGILEKINQNSSEISAWDLIYANASHEKFSSDEAFQQNLKYSNPIEHQRVIKHADLHKILLDTLTDKACPILWGHSVTQYSLKDIKVEAKVFSDKEQKEHLFDAQYLLITQPLQLFGSSEKTETHHGKGTQIVFEVDNSVVSTMVEMEKSYHDHLLVFQNHKSLNAIIPSYNPNKSFLILKEGSEILKELKKKDNKFWKEIHTSAYTSQHLAQIQDKRIFFLSEAAYSVSFMPFFMPNLYFKDFGNLAWKITRALQYPGIDPIIYTYKEERGVIHKKFLQEELPRICEFLIKPNLLKIPFLKGFKKLFNNYQGEIASSNTLLWAKMNMLDHSYKYSSISINHSQMEIIKTGERFPSLEVYDEKSKSHKNLSQLLHNTHFTLLIVGSIGAHNLWALGKWVQQTYPKNLHIIYLPYKQNNINVFKSLQMHEEQNLLAILRPDRHIAYLSNTIQVHLVSNYLDSIIGNRELDIPF